jgi:anti-sigma factor RsiW
MKMDCQQVLNSISDYSVGLLDPLAAEAYAGHVASCPECSAEARRFDRCTLLLDHMPRREAPADMWLGVRARIELERSLASYTMPVTPVRPVRAWLSGAAAAVAGFACALALLLNAGTMNSVGSNAMAASAPAAVSVSMRNGVDNQSPVADAASSVAVDAASVRPLPDLSVSLARFAPDGGSQPLFLSTGGALR